MWQPNSQYKVVILKPSSSPVAPLSAVNTNIGPKCTGRTPLLAINPNIIQEKNRILPSIPKPLKRNATVLTENGLEVVPPLPLLKKAKDIIYPKEPKQISHAVALSTNNNNCTDFPSVSKFSSPAITSFHDNVQKCLNVESSATASCKDDLLKPKRKKSLSLRKVRCEVPQAIAQSHDEASLSPECMPHQSPKEILLNILPSHYDHKIISVEPLKPYHKNTYDQSEMVHAEVRVNLRSKEAALEWLEDFKQASFTDWRVRRVFPEDSKCLIFKKSFRCHHNTLAQFRSGPAHEKHTKCDAHLIITVKNYNMKRSKDELLKTFPCEIIIQHCHNHPLHAADSLRFRRASKKVKDTFLELFKSNHSPSSALSTYKYDIQVKNPDNWFEILADGAHCPNLQWCYNIYRESFSKEYGAPTGEAMVKSLSAAVDKYNQECGSKCAMMETFEGTDLIVVLCSPLMKRVHQHLRSSGEMNFLDSGGCMDRHNSRVFTFLAPSVAGALPLGMIISSSESEKVLGEGIRMLKSVMPSDAFYGRGPSTGPAVVMTDDSDPERNALRMSFAGVVLLLCLFHILQAYWRYVWDSKHQVPPANKVEVFMMFKTWCYSQTEEEFKKLYNEMLANPMISGNKWLVKQLKGLCERAAEWALCYRSELLIRGNNTDNYSERAIRSFKDDILYRVRAYSVVQLFDFFVTRLEAYFERRIANVLNNRQDHYRKSKHFIDKSKIVHLQCSESQHTNIFHVKNSEKGTQYTVDMHIEICTCPVGKNGAPCKHQFAVSEKFNLTSSQFLPFEDEEAKRSLHKIMTTIPAKPGWYASLKGGPLTERGAFVDQPGESNSNSDLIEEMSDNIADDEFNLAAGATEKPSVLDMEEEQRKAKELWKSIHDYVSNGLDEKPDTFVAAVQKFGKQFMKCKDLSENAVLSAMHTFNNNDSFGLQAVKQGRYINVNKAATVRRKYARMGGRKCTQQGKPPKSAFTSEHGYSAKTQKSAAWDRCGMGRKALPHVMSYKVQNSSVKKIMKK